MPFTAAMVALAALSAGRHAQATDLTSSTTEYVLTAAGNPYTVVPGATIDTRALGVSAMDGERASSWTLTNNGTVAGGLFAVQLAGGFATIVNNGSFLSPYDTAIALFHGGQVTNLAGAVVAAKLDGIYANDPTSSVTNAGIIAGDLFGLVDTQSGVHLPSGGSVDNLPGGIIRGFASGILAAPATTVTNAGLISSSSGPALDLTAGTGTTGSVIINSGTIRGNGGVAIQFGPNDNTLQLTSTSVIDGVVQSDPQSSTNTDTLILAGTAPGSFDLASVGPTAQYRDFNVLMKQDASVWTLTGANTANQAWQISGGALIVAGQLTGSINAAQGANGVAVAVEAGGAIQADSGAAVTVSNGSVVTNDGTIVSRAGAAVVAGSGVSLSNAGTLTGNGVAVRFTGSNDTMTLDTGSIVSGDLNGGNGAGNALILQGSGTLASPVYGFATLTMSGAAWTLSGNAAMTSATRLDSGTLQLDGVLTAPTVALASAAALTGTGTVDGALVAHGTVTPGDAVVPQVIPVSVYVPTPLPLSIGTLDVNGTYTQSAGSRYVLEVAPGGNDLIDVNGDAALQGGTVVARLRAASFSLVDTYRILTASQGVTGSFTAVETLNPFVQPSLVYDANNVYLQVKRGFQNAGGTPNQIAVEAALDHGVAGIASHAPPSADFLTIAADLVSLEGPSAYAALDQLSAEAYAALPNAHFLAAQTDMNAIDARLVDTHGNHTCAQAEISAPGSAENGMASTGDARLCSWAAILGDTARIGGYDTWLTQQIDMAGAIAGLDYRLTPPLTLGAAFAWLHGNTSTDSLPVHSEFDSYQAMLYGSYVPGLYWLDTMLGYARNDDQMKRSILFTDPSRTAQGDANGNQYFASLRTGVDLPVGAMGVITPFAGLEAQYVELSGLNETGAGAVDLQLPGSSASAVRSLLGTQWRKTLAWAGRQWRFDVQAAWVHAYGALTRSVDASFKGAPSSSFVVHGSGPARDAAQLALSASVTLGQHARAFLRCGGEFGAHDNAITGVAGIAYLW
ncbi:autotransporter domain-containing protein [Paraburkholderia sp. DHOC27]|uniref:autotransporter outer membrane beta-barrel domain-containing protein n=1 Tax=Paraburkholderia sp. DHOC27 TaxID=2303330 RepID=UPI0015F2FED6|nr:autotransporter outer membrane beta-barrel domain-containing protein [Paraburkholderia sp. DHOC27]